MLLHRPVQWTKNVVVLSALVFGGRADSPAHVANALLAMVTFCLVSSAGYIWNDWWDRERDRLHPEKRFRPIASGKVRPKPALMWSGGLILGASILSLGVSASLFAVIVLYMLLTGAYTARLKLIPVLDVVVLALAFVLRAIAGAVAVDVPMSRWLIVCTVLLALFLGFGKRRHELVTLRERAALHRPSLGAYSEPMLDALIGASAGLTLIAYTAYAATTPTVTMNWPMLTTVPPVAFALGRYVFLIYRHNLGGSPEHILLHDRLLIAAILAWSVLVVALLMRFQVS